MEDTFSKLKKGITAFGAKPPDDYGEEEEEEDIDFLNDETFGGEIEEGDFDWEEEHEKYAGVIELEHHRNGKGVRDSGYGTTDKSYRSQEEYMEHSISQLVVDDEEDEDVEDPAILNISKSYKIPKREQNLDELFGPSSPPAFLDTEHLVSPSSRNIWGSPTKESHLQKPVNNLQRMFDYAKASSASAHLQKGQTLEELESKMLQQPRTVTQPVTAEELERVMRGEGLPQPQQQQPVPRFISPQDMAKLGYQRMQEHNARVLEEHTNRLLEERNSRVADIMGMTPPGRGHMLQGRNSPLAEMMSMTPPGRGQVLQGRNSPLADMMSMTPPGRGQVLQGRNSPLADMMSMTPPGRGQVLQGRNSPLADMMTPPRQSNMSPLSMLNNRQSPLGVPSVRRSTPSPPTYSVSPLVMQSPLSQARLISPYSRGQILEILANRAPTAPIGIPRQMGRGSFQGSQSPYSSPAQQSPYNRNVYNSPANQHQSPSRYPIPHGHHMDQSPSNRYPHPNRPPMDHSPARFSTPQPNRIQHSHHLNGNTDPRQNRGRGRGNYSPRGDKYNNQSYRDREYRENRTYNNRRYYQYNAEKENRRVDDYAGLMTQKEKDWIIKIQLLQLQTDNPYIDDYYYTTFAMKKKALERQKQLENGEIDGNKEEPELVIPAMAKLETKAYKPAHFEGSLGRLTTSSVHNPRQIIDLQSHDIHEEGQGHNANKELRKARQLLMEIEKGYNLLLEVDDIEKKILALPEEARTPLFEQRHEMLFSLYKYLISDDFVNLMSVRKGRKLLGRVIPNLDKKNAEEIVMLILKKLQVLLKKDTQDQGLMVLHDPVVKTIQSCDLKTLVQLSSAVISEQETTSQALQNQFGSSVICTLIHRGEVLYKQTSPLDIDNQLQTEWCQLVHDLASILTSVPLESLVRPKLPQSTISGHFDRLLNKKQIASLEDKLKIIAEDSQKVS